MDKNKVICFVKTHGTIIFYMLQILFILIYMEPEMQEFIYVRF